MTFDQSFFINLLSDHINGRKTCVSFDTADWKHILYYAQIQQVEGIVFQQCKSFMPEDIKNVFREKYYASIDCYAKREYLAKEVMKSLREKNIESFIVKGFPVASYYPMPPLRTMGDTDIVVHSEDRNRVNELLLEMGYISESHLDGREWIFFKGKFMLELHNQLIYSEAINRKVHEAFFGDFWDYVHNCELDWDYHFIYLILHLRKHLMNCGVGFRQFMDVAVVAKNNDKLDWKWIEEQLVKLDLIAFSKIVFALNERWFGVKSPIQIQALDDSFYEIATEQVFNNGVFGFDNEENRDNLAVNNARKGKNAKASMVASAARKIFPNYTEMVSVPKYSFIKGNKWLLPIAWIYSFFCGLHKKRFSDKMRVVKSSFVSKETIEKREEFLKQWGLDEVD